MQPKTTDSQDVAALRAAFDAFNRASGELEHSYNGLQTEVADLKAQLREAKCREAKEASRNAELAQRLSALIEALPGGVVMLDERGLVRQINAAAGDFLGEPLQNHEWTLVCRRAFRDDTDEQGDLTLHDGRRLSIAQKPIKPGPGRVLLLNDVTENRKLQELLSRHRRLAAMGEMAAALAHQIRTPLSAALLYTSNAARPGVADERKNELLGKATRCLHDLEQLISDMLQFARGAGSTQASCDLQALLAATENALSPLLEDAQRVSIRTGATGVRIRGNREALVGALLNLISNALQHAGANADVIIDVRANALQAEISVRDNGPGVPPDARAHIFDPFFTSRPDGTGLGLAVARSVARAHAGDLVLVDDAGPGATFLLTLPVCDARESSQPRQRGEEVAA